MSVLDDTVILDLTIQRNKLQSDLTAALARVNELEGENKTLNEHFDACVKERIRDLGGDIGKLVKKLLDRDAIVLVGLFYCVPLMREAAHAIANLLEEAKDDNRTLDVQALLIQDLKGKVAALEEKLKLRALSTPAKE